MNKVEKVVKRKRNERELTGQLHKGLLDLSTHPNLNQK